MGNGSENRSTRETKSATRSKKYGKDLSKMKDADVSSVMNSLVKASGAKSSNGLSKKLGSLVSDKSTKSQYSALIKSGNDRALISAALKEYTQKGKNSSKLAKTIASSMNKVESNKSSTKKTTKKSTKKTTKKSSGKSTKSTSGGTTRKMTAAERKSKFGTKTTTVNRGFTKPGSSTKTTKKKKR